MDRPAVALPAQASLAPEGAHPHPQARQAILLRLHERHSRGHFLAAHCTGRALQQHNGVSGIS